MMVDMALSIKHPEADRLARELAELTGEGITEAVLNALRERLARVKKRRVRSRPLADGLRAIGEAVDVGQGGSRPTCVPSFR